MPRVAPISKTATNEHHPSPSLCLSQMPCHHLIISSTIPSPPRFQLLFLYFLAKINKMTSMPFHNHLIPFTVPPFLSFVSPPKFVQTKGYSQKPIKLKQITHHPSMTASKTVCFPNCHLFSFIHDFCPFNYIYLCSKIFLLKSEKDSKNIPSHHFHVSFQNLAERIPELSFLL